jgi:aryl-alcohol dehydrogenase-like predicted oxidoreductase
MTSATVTVGTVAETLKQIVATDPARKHSTTLLNIALAYVLAQDLPIFPIIGPLTLDELRGSLNALDVRLTEDELRWLKTGV